jgi:SAM-dependent methyltransferase
VRAGSSPMNPEQTRLNASLEDRHWWFSARRRIVREVAHALVPPSKDVLVIDIGCGTGGNSGALAGEYRVVGIDASCEAIRLASQRFPSARFVCGAVPKALDGALSEARLVLIMDMLEHVEDDFALFSSVLAETKPGCHFFITVPADPALWSKHDEAGLHWRRYTQERLERIWRDLPVERLLVTHFMSRLAPFVRAIRAMNNKLGRTSGEANTDVRVPNAIVNRALESIFGGESVKLRRALEERRDGVYEDGVSLLAVLKRTAGEVRVRTKPLDVPRDVHSPQA